MLAEFRAEFARESAHFVTYTQLQQATKKLKELDKTFVKTEVFSHQLAQQRKDITKLDSSIKENKAREGVKLKEYATKELVHSLLIEQKKNVEKALQKNQSFTDMLEGFEGLISDIKADQSNIEKIIENMSIRIGKLSGRLQDKVDHKELATKLELYCSYTNLQDVYEKVVPPIKQFETKINKFTQE